MISLTHKSCTTHPSSKNQKDACKRIQRRSSWDGSGHAEVYPNQTHLILGLIFCTYQNLGKAQLKNHLDQSWKLSDLNPSLDLMGWGSVWSPRPVNHCQTLWNKTFTPKVYRLKKKMPVPDQFCLSIWFKIKVIHVTQESEAYFVELTCPDSDHTKSHLLVPNLEPSTWFHGWSRANNWEWFHG